jgi:hypothetical protein
MIRKATRRRGAMRSEDAAMTTADAAISVTTGSHCLRQTPSVCARE